MDIVEVDMSLPKLETSISFPVDSVNKQNIKEFLSSKFLADDEEIRWTVKIVLSHFSYRSNVNMKSLFLAMFLDNAIVEEYSMSKDKISYYINYGISPVFRDEMLRTCVK